MNNPIPRRHALAAIGAVLLASTPFSVPSKASDVSAHYKDFSGAWQVDRHRGPAGRRGPGDGRGPHDRRGPPPEGRGERLGPPDGPGGPGGEEVKIAGVNVPGLERGDRHTYSIMTPAGKAAFAAMDPLDLPANNCKSPGLPSIAMTPTLQIWSATGDTLTIHHEYYDTVREIHLDRRTHPARRGAYARRRCRELDRRRYAGDRDDEPQPPFPAASAATRRGATPARSSSAIA